MSRPEKEGHPFQPDGSILSLVGDLLFAGAILVMIYPCLRKTVSRLNGQFFRQFFHISEILLAVVALCFVLMLLIGQQMRMAYCSFIRPFVGSKDEDKAYISMVLKIMLCGIVLFNYFCADGLQKIMSLITESIQPATAAQERMQNAGTQNAQFDPYRDALTNNSNTNSQTPVTQTQSVMQSDILTSMSFPELSSEACQGPVSPVYDVGRKYRDVGTMVRFPVSTEEQPLTSSCTFNFCSAPSPYPRPSTAPPNIIFTSLPSATTCSPHSNSVTFRDTGTGRVPYWHPHSGHQHHHHYQPAQFAEGGARRVVGSGSGTVYADNSCPPLLSNGWGPGQQASGSGPGLWSTFHSAGRTGGSYTSCVNYQQRRGDEGGGGVHSDPSSSIFSSDYTSSGSSSSTGVSDQESFLSRLGLTSVRGDGSNRPQLAVNVESSFHRDLGSPCGQPRNTSVTHGTTTTTTTSGHIEGPPGGPGYTWSYSSSSSSGYRPLSAQSSFHINRKRLSPTPHSPTTCTVPSHSSLTAGTVHTNQPTPGTPRPSTSSWAVPTHVLSSSHTQCCVMSAGPHSSHHSSLTVMQCTKRPPTPSVSRGTNTTPRVVRRHRLPPMPRMTRSGKIYGYG